MTAKEMFEKLSFKQIEEDEYSLKYYSNEIYYDVTVYFNKEKQSYIVTYNIEIPRSITLELHKAIHQQMKELGWLE